jgi:DnaJ-class molecular chaperone
VECSICHGRGSIVRDKDKCVAVQSRSRKTTELPTQMQEMQRRENYERKNKRGDIHREGDGRPTTNCSRRSWGSTGIYCLLLMDELVTHTPFSNQPDVPAGDVVFVLHAKHHDSFERSGNDLLTHVKITLSEALLGFSRILITHLDGRGIKVTSPPCKVLKPGSVIVLRNEGMPMYKHPDQKGDLYVILDIEMPEPEWLEEVDRKVKPRRLIRYYCRKNIQSASRHWPS